MVLLEDGKEKLENSKKKWETKATLTPNTLTGRPHAKVSKYYAKL